MEKLHKPVKGEELAKSFRRISKTWIPKMEPMVAKNSMRKRHPRVAGCFQQGDCPQSGAALNLMYDSCLWTFY
jgi:hypothetical protein